MKERIVYYKDECNDDFAGTNIKTKPVPPDFKYCHTNIFWLILEFILYRIIAQPLTALFNKIAYGMTIKNRKVLAHAKGRGYFMYANHVLIPGDAFTPQMAAFPRRANVIVGADAVSLRGIKNVVLMLGGIPLPSSKSGYKNYMDCIKRRIAQKRAVVFYPEAHIWPYYTGVRRFSAASFHFPSDMNVPVFSMTTTFKKSRFRKKPKAVVYIDGPFYPKMELPLPTRKQALCDEVYETMLKRSQLSTYEYIRYIKQTD